MTNGHHEIKVEDPQYQCPWCDGTGYFAPAAGKFGSCWACDGTGDTRQETAPAKAEREKNAKKGKT